MTENNLLLPDEKNPVLMAANRLGFTENNLRAILMDTVFPSTIKHQITEEQIFAFLAIANLYNLNPIFREIYAFPNKHGPGITPIVSIDGWIKIANDHDKYDGFETQDTFDNDGNIICVKTLIYRTDRSRPIPHTEYLEECKENTGPWISKPKRMLGHKSFIQCSRYAFSISGVIDEFEYFDSDVVQTKTPGYQSLDSQSAPLQIEKQTREEMLEGFDGAISIKEIEKISNQVMYMDFGKETLDTLRSARDKAQKRISK